MIGDEYSLFADKEGKDFGAAGLRVGCAITRNKELQNAVKAIA